MFDAAQHQEKDRDYHAETKSDGAESCPASPAYSKIMEQLANVIYDPGVIKNASELKSKYNCLIKSDEDAVKFADMEIEKLDYPYTNLFDKKDADVIKSNHEGHFLGIGMALVNSNLAGKPKSRVDSLVKGGSAEESGINVGDYIVKVDGKDARNLSNNEITALIRSEQAVPVNLVVERDGKEIEFKNVPRREVKTSALEKVENKNGIVHITMTSFEKENCSEELKTAIEAYPQAKAFIIDLRSNSGGLIEESLKSLSLFIGEGKLLSQHERIDGKQTGDETSYSTTSYLLRKDRIELDTRLDKFPGLRSLSPSIKRFEDLVDKPVVVLVDGRTASSSEIFAAAMQENKAATIIGSQTFGKGIGQTYYTDMPAGSLLTVTNLRFYSPQGKWFGDGKANKFGISPDIVVPSSKDALSEAYTYLQGIVGKQGK